MSATTVPAAGKKRRISGSGAGGNGTGPHRNGNGGGPPEGPKRPPEDRFRPEKYMVGVWVAVASILMLFVALTSAYVVRSSRLSSDVTAGGQSFHLPSLIWINTAVLIASSICLETARRLLRLGKFPQFNRWMTASCVLGLAFLAGQIQVWRELARQGLYLYTSSHSSFFYLITGLHGVHLLGGLIALAFVTAGGYGYRFDRRHRAMTDAAALYWHFMDGLWVCLFALLDFWR